MTCFRMKDGRTVRSFLNKDSSYCAFQRRIEKGDTIEEALEYVSKEHKRGRACLVYFYQGKPIIDICRERGINYHTVYERIQRGLEINETIFYKGKLK